MALLKWNKIDNVPSHFGRHQRPPNEGKPRDEFSTRSFKNKLDACFNELWTHSGLGKADIIVTAGAFTKKPGKHGQGEAFDLDGIIWEANDRRPRREWYAVEFASDPQFYWGVGGILIRHFRHVLHAKYNAAHEDHYHVDTTHAPSFSTKSESCVKFLQSALTHVHASPLVIDGDFGKKTEAATAAVLDRLAIPGDITTSSTWKAFGLETAKIGMGATAPSPPDDRDPDREKDKQEKPRTDVPALPAPSVLLFLKRPRMRGAEVKAVQDALRDAGFSPGRSDGIFGQKTDAAVRQFQKARGLKVDGVLGPITAAALGMVA